MNDVAQAVAQVGSVTPSANANLAWSYMTTGGSTLNAPSAGNGRVYVASNGSKMIALNSSTGLISGSPSATGDFTFKVQVKDTGTPLTGVTPSLSSTRIAKGVAARVPSAAVSPGEESSASTSGALGP